VTPRSATKTTATTRSAPKTKPAAEPGT
jgi:hypothetical protein